MSCLIYSLGTCQELSGADKEILGLVKQADSCFVLENNLVALDLYTKVFSSIVKEKWLSDSLKTRQNNFLFCSYLKAGDELYSKNEFELAMKKYQNANTLFPTKHYPLVQIQNCFDKIPKRELCPPTSIKMQYDELIAQAEKLFSEREFIKAKLVYLKALEIVAEDMFAKKKIEECETILVETQLLIYAKIYDEKKRLKYEGTTYHNDYWTGREYQYHAKKKKKRIIKNWVAGVLTDNCPY